MYFGMFTLAGVRKIRPIFIEITVRPVGDSRPSLLGYHFRSLSSTVGESIERYWPLVLAILVLTTMVHQERKGDTANAVAIHSIYVFVHALLKKNFNRMRVK